MKEQWKEFIRWKSDNEKETTDAIVYVSNKGRVKRSEYKRWNCKNKSYSTYKEKIYKPTTNRGKQRNESKEHIERFGLYQSVKINKKSYQIHRMVAKCFIPNSNNLPQVDHINERRDDNNVSNLRWCTNDDNHKFLSMEKRDIKSKKSSSMTELQTIKALEMRLNGYTCKHLSEIYCVHLETIRIRTLKIANEDELKILRRK